MTMIQLSTMIGYITYWLLSRTLQMQFMSSLAAFVIAKQHALGYWCKVPEPMRPLPNDTCIHWSLLTLDQQVSEPERMVALTETPPLPLLIALGTPRCFSRGGRTHGRHARNQVELPWSKSRHVNERM